MSTDNDNELVVTAGYETVLTKVGAGMAYVDVPAGEPLPADVSDEDRTRLIKAGAVSRRDGKPLDEAPDSAADAARAARPVPGEVEPDEIDTDVIPGGSTEQVLEWVGDDLARARVARHEEMAKGDHARADLVGKLEDVMASLETEPPSPAEHITDGQLGGAAVTDGTTLGEQVGGKTEDDVPAGGRAKPTRTTRK